MALLLAFLIAVMTAIFELYIYEKKIRKQRFMIVLGTRSLFYLILILTVIVSEIGLARMIKDDLTFSQLMQNKDFNFYIFGGEFVTSVFYTFALVVVINFSRQISRKLGQGVLISFITGRYYHPVERDKIFMFLNIPSSNLIIEKIGRLKFHFFINEIVYDITTPILSNYGIIYQYVEDEIVITWKMKEGLKNAHVIRCFFDIKDRIHELKEKYILKYGVTPTFNAGLHCGKVIKGEIGYIKSEIVYHGDVLNTASRILGICHTMSREILASAQLLKYLKIPDIYKPEKCGDIKLKGKKDPMELFSIDEINIKSMTFN